MASKIDETPLYTPVQLVFKLHETRSIPTVVFFIRLSLFQFRLFKAFNNILLIINNTDGII